MRTFLKTIKPYLELCKIRIALLSVFSSFSGFMLSSGDFKSQAITMLAGVFLLACGSSALNQYQEREIDALMPRICKRPIPSGRVKPVNALYFSFSLLISGLAVLLTMGNLIVLFLGFFAVIWYNGVYTLIKRISAFAVIPGALIGAIPPAMGWIAGGGILSDPRLLIVCFFFFIWQVPHFWLLIIKFGEEYEKAGLPSLTRIFTEKQLQRITFNWIAATSISCLFLPACGIVRNFPITISLIAASSWLVWSGIKSLLGNPNPEQIRIPVFRKINAYMFLVLLLLSADKLLSLS